MPFEQVFGLTGLWDDLPAAHAAAIALTCSRWGCCSRSACASAARRSRSRSPTRGSPTRSRCTRWSPTPTTRSWRCCCSPSCSSPAPRLRAGCSPRWRASRSSPRWRSSPLFATHGLRELPRRAGGCGRWRCSCSRPAPPSCSSRSPRSRTTRCTRSTSARRLPGQTAARPSRCGGSTAGLRGWQTAVQVGAVLLALALAVIPRRPGVPALAAAAAAILIALQLGIDHWFYLYIPWFFALVLVALFEVPAAPPRPGPPLALPAGLAVLRGRAARRYAVGGAGGLGISTCSIESARNGCEQRTTTPFSHGSSSEVSKAHRHLRDHRLQRQLALDPDHPAAGAGHADVGDVRGAPGQHPPVGRRDVGVGAHHRAHAPVEVPARARSSHWSPRRACPRGRGRPRPVLPARRRPR